MAAKSKQRGEYVETPDYGTLWQDVEACKEPGGRPQFSGKGVLAPETVKAIKKAGGAFQIAVWTMDRDGEPMRAKDGGRRFRLHIEPVWQEADDNSHEQAKAANRNGRNSPLDDGTKAVYDDDLPF